MPLSRVFRIAVCLLACAFYSPAWSQTPPQVYIPVPYAHLAAVDTFPEVIVLVQSANEIISVVAVVGSKSVNLVPGRYRLGGGCSCSMPSWNGWADLSGLPLGPHEIVITATDALGNSGSASRMVVYDSLPTIEITSPLPHDIARPLLAVVASCTDNNPAGCSKLEAYAYNQTEGMHYPIAVSKSRLNYVVDLSKFEASYSPVTLEIRATDSTGRIKRVMVPISVESSGGLEESTAVLGQILDVDSGRILYLNDNPGQVAIRDRATGTDTVIYSVPPVPGPFSPNNLLSGLLTPSGAAFSFFTSGSPGPSLVKSFEAGVLHDLGEGGVGGEGPFVAWSQGSNLYRRDVVAGSTVGVTGTGFGLWDVASNGAVAFQGTDYDIYLYRPDGSTTTLTSDPDNVTWNTYPRTDGGGVLYTKSAPNNVNGRLFLARGGTHQDLDAAMLYGSRPYNIANGWIAYERPGPSNVQQVWRMDPAGAKTQLTFLSVSSQFEKLADDGSLTFMQYAGPTDFRWRRYLVSGSSTTPAEVGSRQGTFHFAGNTPYVSVDRTLFSVNVPALRSNPAALPFVAHQLGRTSTPMSFFFTNTGSAPVTLGTVTVTGDFAVSSNNCTTVAPAGTCAIAMTFTPTATGFRSGTLTIGGAGAQQVRSLSGIGVPVERFVNVATRMQVLTGDDVMIAGFVIQGTGSKKVVVRARGPSMAAQGVAGVLANPKLDLYKGPTQIGSNDDWQAASNAAELSATGFAPAHANEAAILTTIGPGAYSAIVSGVGGTTGVAIVEVFEVDNSQLPLVNMSTRGKVQTGENVMIGGFIIQGDTPQTVVVRARGPSLAQFGVPGVLADPVLQIFSGQTQLAVNNNWQEATNASAVQASGFAPSDLLESAILITLQPGAYSAIVSGVPGATGVAIVELFKVDAGQ